jgi:hypothetical protein
MKISTKNIKEALKKYEINTLKHQINAANIKTTLNKGVRMIASVQSHRVALHM